MFIMYKDKPVVRFNLDKDIYEVLDEQLLPIRLKDALFSMPEKTDVDKFLSCSRKNYSAIISFLGHRVLSLDRKNAKQLLNAYNLSQSQELVDKARLAITCRAVSMTDNYWIAMENNFPKWSEINPKHIHLNEIVTQIALHGDSITLQGEPRTPELNGNGSYAHAWQRRGNKTYFLKASTKNGKESQIEESVCKILNHFNVYHTNYEVEQFKDLEISVCPNISMDNLNMVSAEDVFSYCNRKKIDFIDYCLQIDAENIYKMCIIDYLITNDDRHKGNWGFYQDDYGKLKCCHPLYDHNNAFYPTNLDDISGGQSKIFNGTKQDVAKMALKRCDFKMLSPVLLSDFVSLEHYNSFMKKAVSIGLYREVKPDFMQKLHIKPYQRYVPVKISTDNFSNIMPVTIQKNDTKENIVAESVLDTNIERAKQKESVKNTTEFNRDDISHEEL